MSGNDAREEKLQSECEGSGSEDIYGCGGGLGDDEGRNGAEAARSRHAGGVK